ncbi:MAG TPA: hypothetical protein VHE13_04380 [Opitutus sp.]|nr:hypothetical protein [Opitutus sp.]
MSNSRCRGSALITVLLFCFLLVTIAASVMNWALTERRLNARSAYWLEARNAAEAVAEYGCYQVAKGFNTSLQPSFSTGGTPGPITFPSSLAESFFAGSRVDTDSLEIKAGAVESLGLTYIDPTNPNNQYDPLVGRYVNRRDITIVAKATVDPPTGGGNPVTAYILEKVSIRGAPLLAYAIFYSANDLEFNETPQMDIYGPVHVNGNLFVGPAGGSPQPLTFHGAVTASGNVYHAWRGTTSTAQEGGSAMSSTTAVNFSTDTSISGSPSNMRGSDGTWRDSTMGADAHTSGLDNLEALITPARTTQFRQFASQTWKGNLQTAAMGITSYNPMGFDETVGTDGSGNDVVASTDEADDGANVGTGAGYGHGYGPHSLIEPPLAVSSSDTYASAKTSLEEQKFSRKASLYLKVAVDAAGAGTMTLYGDPNSAPAGTPSSDLGPNGGIKLGTVPGDVFQYIPYGTTDVTTTTTDRRGRTTSTTRTYVSSGMYDQHQDTGVNLVQINMQALSTALSHMADTSTTAGTAGTDLVASDNSTKWGQESSSNPTGYNIEKSGSTGWNGGIYVDVESADTSHQTGVILSNGTISSGSSMTPMGSDAINGNEGLTVATNMPVYVLGNLNADGSVNTTTSSNSALYPDDKSGGTAVTDSSESPMAIAADAVTVLSDNFFNTGGSGGANLVEATNDSDSSAYNNLVTVRPNDSNRDVEIAAAFISGTIETSPDSSGTQQYSGGVHNFPRFLEYWRKTVAIRGSIVNMYKSRIATVGWSQTYYSAPVRQWGYDQIFANGKFPPMIPQVLSYRRVDFTYLDNGTAYNDVVDAL